MSETPQRAQAPATPPQWTCPVHGAHQAYVLLKTPKQQPHKRLYCAYCIAALYDKMGVHQMQDAPAKD